MWSANKCPNGQTCKFNGSRSSSGSIRASPRSRSRSSSRSCSGSRGYKQCFEGSLDLQIPGPCVLCRYPWDTMCSYTCVLPRLSRFDETQRTPSCQNCRPCLMLYAQTKEAPGHLTPRSGILESYLSVQFGVSAGPSGGLALGIQVRRPPTRQA